MPVCVFGSSLSCCSALEPAAEKNCVLCTEGSELVDSGAVKYVRRDNKQCYCNCSAGLFTFQMLVAHSCQICSLLPEQGCAAGTVWHPCSHAYYTAYVPCPDILLLSGPYASNKQYLESVNKSNSCQKQYRAGAYQSYDYLM